MLQFGNISFDSILWFCACGYSFFLGLLILVITLLIPSEKKWAKYPLYLLRTLGLLFVVLSTTPLHPFLYASGLILLIACFIRRKKQTILKVLFTAFALLITFAELPFHISPSISTDNINCIYVIGDSVSAGMGNKNEETWPTLLEKLTGIKTVNLARAGATTESALKQSKLILDNSSLVVLEIGGNDLLGHTSIEKFETSCNELLDNLASCGKIVWLELPLLPQYYPYGRIQRRLARQHNIVLTPKSLLAKVFNAKGATSDGI
ncbi:MAG: SGNH/GDSL hydrolase family protein, partial [Planctomycetota bacterium]